LTDLEVVVSPLHQSECVHVAVDQVQGRPAVVGTGRLAQRELAGPKPVRLLVPVVVPILDDAADGQVVQESLVDLIHVSSYVLCECLWPQSRTRATGVSSVIRDQKSSSCPPSRTTTNSLPAPE